MPADTAAATVEATYKDLPIDSLDGVILVDDCRTDDTVAVARGLGIHVIEHDRSRGYSGDQKTCG